jgi:hypothetical protein
MGYGNIGGALFEVAHGISAGKHEAIDEHIGFGDGTLRIIDKARLHHAPVRDELLALVGGKFMNLELLHPLFALKQNGIRTLCAYVANGTVIFGAEVLSQLGCALFARDDEGEDEENHHRDDDYR